MSQEYCSKCGSTWGGYTPHQESHYCVGGQREFRDKPSHADRETECARLRDPHYARQVQVEREEAIRRGQ